MMQEGEIHDFCSKYQRNNFSDLWYIAYVVIYILVSVLEQI